VYIFYPSLHTGLFISDQTADHIRCFFQRNPAHINNHVIMNRIVIILFAKFAVQIETPLFAILDNGFCFGSGQFIMRFYKLDPVFMARHKKDMPGVFKILQNILPAHPVRMTFPSWASFSITSYRV